MSAPLLLLRGGTEDTSGIPTPTPDVVTLTTVWFHSYPDYSDYIEIVDGQSVEGTITTQGSTVMFAAGNTGSIRRRGKLQSLPLKFQALDYLTFEALKARQGLRQMYRDPSGRLLHGWFNDLQFTEWVTNPLVDVSLTFEELTEPEAV